MTPGNFVGDAARHEVGKGEDFLREARELTHNWKDTTRAEIFSTRRKMFSTKHRIRQSHKLKIWKKIHPLNE